MKNQNATTTETPAFTLGEPTPPPAAKKPLPEPTPHNLWNRRKISTTDILDQIDRALKNSALSEDSASSAPTTAAFIRELDGFGSGPRNGYGDQIKLFPPQIFSRYDPTEIIYGDPKRHDYGKFIVFTPETLAAVIASGSTLLESTEILPDAEIAKLRDIDKKFKAIQPQFSKFSNNAASEEFHNQSHRRVSETLTGGALPSATIRTHESIITEFAANRRALDELQIELSHQAYPLVLKAYGKTFEIVRAVMANLEAGERHTAEAFHIPWAPSYLWKTCAAIQIRLHPKRLVDNVTDQISPSSLLVGILKL